MMKKKNVKLFFNHWKFYLWALCLFSLKLDLNTINVNKKNHPISNVTLIGFFKIVEYNTNVHSEILNSKSSSLKL